MCFFETQMVAALAYFFLFLFPYTFLFNKKEKQAVAVSLSTVDVVSATYCSVINVFS
jgi:hypothetical protein